MASKSNSLPIFSIILILGLLGLNAYQWLSNSKLKTNLNDKNSEYLELEKVNSELNSNYEAKLEELEGLRGDNQELNSKIDTQVEELAKQKKKISGLIWTEKELGKARLALTELNSQADQYIAQISQLKKEVDVLNTKNTALTEQNQSLDEEVRTNKATISNLDSVRTLLVSQTEELSSDNDNLSSKVDMAEAIKINYLEVKGYDIKDNGDYKERSRAKKVDVLRACFTTETNLVTPPGEEEFQVSIVSPGGETLYVESLGSGTVTNKLTGKEVRYTIAGSTEYDNEDLQACMDWQPNFALSSGTYSVEIFNDGYPVGKGQFSLK